MLLTDLIGILEQQQGVERVLAYVTLHTIHIHTQTKHIHTLDQNEMSNTWTSSVYTGMQQQGQRTWAHTVAAYLHCPHSFASEATRSFNITHSFLLYFTSQRSH